MIPRPLVEPFAPPREQRPPRKVAAVLGTLLCGFAVIGAVVWVMTLTPFGFSRFSSESGRVADRIEDIDQPGTYLVFEERTGASQPALPPPVTVIVTSKGGDLVPVEALVRPSTVASPLPYHTPWHEGRAIARFTITQPGSYHVRAMPVGRRQSIGYGPRTTGQFALGRDDVTTWLGSWLGALVYIGVPLVAGLILLLIARRRRPPVPPDPVRAEPPVLSTTLTAHG